MSDNSSIEWTDATWMAIRDGKLDEVELLKPLHWRKQRRVVLKSDLFHENVSDETIDRVFAVMALCPQHTFQVLTKRAERMAEYLTTKDSPLDNSRADIVFEKAAHTGKIVWDERGSDVNNYRLVTRANPENVSNRRVAPTWPLPNVWLGVSIENQKAADERIPQLLRTPAAVRWLSCEPLLGAVDLTAAFGSCRWCAEYPTDPETNIVECRRCDSTGIGDEMQLDWVVCGGESGSGARPMHPDWARSLRDQCHAAGVPFFFKQWGEWAAIDQPQTQNNPMRLHENEQWLNRAGGSGYHGEQVWRMLRVGKKTAGRVLDGKTWDEYPERKAVTQ